MLSSLTTQSSLCVTEALQILQVDVSKTTWQQSAGTIGVYWRRPRDCSAESDECTPIRFSRTSSIMKGVFISRVHCGRTFVSLCGKDWDDSFVHYAICLHCAAVLSIRALSNNCIFSCIHMELKRVFFFLKKKKLPLYYNKNTHKKNMMSVNPLCLSGGIVMLFCQSENTVQFW